MFLRVIEGALPRFIPGQFISISIPLDDETRTRPYTIASSPEDGEPIEICFNRVSNGRGVAYLFERRIGDELGFTGPYGLFTLEDAPPAEVVFVAEGTSIAPVRPMLRRALERGGSHRMHLLYAARDDAHLIYREEIEGWSRRYAQLSVDLLTAASGTAANDPWVTLNEIVHLRWVAADSNRARQFYLCGAGAGVIRVRDLLRASGYERRSVRYEQW